MLKNLASSLFLTERQTDPDVDTAIPKVKGRVITTLQKAKEVRSLVEKCITIARKSLQAEKAAVQFATTAERGSDKWRQWRNSDQWVQWNNAIAPAVAARRRVLQMIGDKQAVRVLFEEVAPRFEERKGGYTRVLRLAQPRLGDAGTRAILEFVGEHDRVRQVSQRPAFDDLEEEEASASETPDIEDQAEPGSDEDAQPVPGDVDDGQDAVADSDGSGQTTDIRTR
jgi:large subunit ribosomal protein L17